MLKNILLIVKPYWSRLVAATALSLIISGLNGGLAWLVKPALDGIFVKKDAKLLTLLPIAILFMYLLRGVFSFFQSYLMRSVGAKVVRDIRNKLYNHLLYLPVNDFKKESSGLLLSKTINDTGQLQGLLAHTVKDIFVEGATIIVLLFIAFYRRWDLALISITVLPFAFYNAQRFGKRLKKVSKEAQKKISFITELLTETFSGIKMIKIFNREESLIKLFHEKAQDYYRQLMRSTRIIEFTSLMMEVVGGIGIAFVLWYGGRLVIKEVITPGDFFSFLAAIFMVYTPAKRLVAANNGIQQSKAFLERINDLFIREKEIDGKKEIEPLKNCIEFKNVFFKYPTSKNYVLNNINLTVKKGEIIAIVGKSGAGKTSLVDLIPRFYDPTSGAIYFDGIDIREATLRSLRNQIGLVSQDIFLFNDTIKANILFGNPSATEKDIINVAKAAYAHEFILELPNGYDTIIGERGIMISGGQRQRISIARALLKNPPILLLDEATSSLDTESERMVQIALDELMKNRTTFVIAHRLSTIKRANRIVVLEKGKILEVGTHEDLIKQNGIYSKLYNMQVFSEK